MAERLLDVIALATIFVVVVYGVLSSTVLPTDRPILVAGIGVLVLLAAAFAVWVLRRQHVFERARNWLRPLADSPRALLSRAGVVLLIATFVLWALEAAVYLAVARSVDLDISMTGALYLVALTNFVAALPAAPGSIGTFDAAVAFGAGRLGASGSAAVSYLIMLRFVLYVPITVVGFVVLVTRYGGWSKLRAPCAPGSGPAPTSRNPAGRRAASRPARPASAAGPAGARPALRRRGAHPLAPADAGVSRTTPPPASAGGHVPRRSADPSPCRRHQRRTAAQPHGVQMAWIIAGCLLVAGLSLLFPSTPTYDPWAWILWGDEIARLDLVTEGGPSWKPLPILFTTPFSLLGHDVAPYLWLWVARAGGLLACVMATGSPTGWSAAASTGRSPASRPSPRCSPATSTCATPRSATPSRSSRPWCSGRSSATSTGAATTRSTSAWPPRCCAPRRGPSSRCTGSTCGSPSRV